MTDILGRLPSVNCSIVCDNDFRSSEENVKNGNGHNRDNSVDEGDMMMMIIANC